MVDDLLHGPAGQRRQDYIRKLAARSHRIAFHRMPPVVLGQILTPSITHSKAAVAGAHVSSYTASNHLSRDPACQGSRAGLALFHDWVCRRPHWEGNATRDVASTLRSDSPRLCHTGVSSMVVFGSCCVGCWPCLPPPPSDGLASIPPPQPWGQTPGRDGVGADPSSRLPRCGSVVEYSPADHLPSHVRGIASRSAILPS